MRTVLTTTLLLALAACGGGPPPVYTAQQRECRYEAAAATAGRNGPLIDIEGAVTQANVYNLCMDR